MMHYKKNFFAIILMVVLLLALNGCTNSKQNTGNEPPKTTTENSGIKETAVMDQFNNLLQKSDVIAEGIIKFMDENIASLSQQNASSVLIALERNQQLLLVKLQDKFANNDVVQITLAKDYRGSLTDSYINGIQEKVTKDLLVLTKNSGLKIETAEGFYFPVIDYSFFKKYRSNVSPDIAAYIDIMAVESDKMPAKDAALMIEWEEILKRASSQENFIKTYGNSVKAEDVKQLVKKYLVFSLYGTNNTPLFSYEDKGMVPAAEKAYLEFQFNASNGNFSQIMTEYRNLLKKNDYKLTKEVDDYRKKAVENFR